MVAFSILGLFGPSRDSAMLRAGRTDLGPARSISRRTRSERPQNRQRDHPLPSFLETTRVDGVKASLHDGTPRSHRQDRPVVDVLEFDPIGAAYVMVNLCTIPGSHGAVAPSRHRRDSRSSDEVVGGFFFYFEAIRTESSDRDAPRRYRRERAERF